MSKPIAELVSEYWTLRQHVLDRNRIRCRAKSGDATALEPYERAKQALQAVEMELGQRGVYRQGRILREKMNGTD